VTVPFDSPFFIINRMGFLSTETGNLLNLSRELDKSNIPFDFNLFFQSELPLEVTLEVRFSFSRDLDRSIKPFDFSLSRQSGVV